MSEPLPRSAILIVNARSRRGRHLFRHACRELKRQGVELRRTVAIRKPEELSPAVSRAVAEGAPMVIVGGGDGSLSSAVDHLVGTDTVFALLPLGTANSFARTLGIPLDMAGAVGVIANGRAERIDLGRIGDDYYANCAAIGLSPLIAETVPHGLKAWAGRPGYLAWAAVQLARFKPFRLTVDDGTHSETLEALEVRIANGRFHGGTELVEEASVSSGEIVVQVVPGRSRATLLRSWGLSLIGPARARGTLREFRGTRFHIATDPPLPISIDGEVLAHTPARAEVAARSIRMALPA
jgi:YegS/Rv2252/BmrU family lipid kinase